MILKHTLMLAIWTKRESPKSQKRSPTTSYTHVAANLTFPRKVCRYSWFQDSNFSWGSESEAVASPRGLSTIVGWVIGSYGIHVKESAVLCWIHFVFCFRWPLSADRNKIGTRIKDPQDLALSWYCGISPSPWMMVKGTTLKSLYFRVSMFGGFNQFFLSTIFGMMLMMMIIIIINNNHVIIMIPMTFARCWNHTICFVARHR